MKVHFPLTGFNLSGGVRVILTIANGLVERGHEVRITVPFKRSQPPFNLDPRVDLRVLGKDGTSRLRYSLLLIREAALWGDVLVATNFKTPHLLRKSIRKNSSRARLLYLVQGYEPYTQGTLFEGPFWRRWINRRAALTSYRKADRRCYVSRGIAERVGLDSDPCLVHPGFNPAIFYPSKSPSQDSRVRVGIIARSGKLKGADVFGKAAADLRDLHPKICWVILRVGNLPDGLPVDAEVLVAQNDQDMAEFYRGLDVFVMPSRYEGFGLPVIEAMACGAATVVSAVDGVREFAEDGRNALIFPVGDTRGLSEAIRSLVHSKELRDRISTRGLETASRFTWTDTIDRFENAVHEIGE